MTRINVVPVQELTDNFILAEYFELPRLYPLIIKAARRDDRQIPDEYVLGTGHMRFFYNKLTYLIRRHSELESEGNKRALKLTIDPMVSIPSDHDMLRLTAWWWQDYLPTAEAIQLNRNRLALRERFVGGLYGSSSL